MLSIKLEDFISTLEYMQDYHNIDPDHGTRTADIALEIGKRLNHGQRLSKDQLQLLEYAARIHDLGRIGVDNHLMSKPGKFTQSQRAAMQEHCQIGYDFLQKANLPYEITGTILFHHEHWDGSGYPQGLKGLDIPLFARIVLIADTYDGIVSERPYHKSTVTQTALDRMNETITWFDPKLFAVFLSVLREVRI